MTIGNQIAHFRKSLNLTQEALARALGVTNQAVSKWESNQACPDIQLLPVLADLFHVTIDELFGRPTPKAAPASLPWKNDNTLHVVLYQGHRLLKSHPAADKITFSYSGPALNITSAVSVSCGDVGGDVDAGTNICCGNVEGDADAGTNISCGNVGGDADAGSAIKCGNVTGDVDAGSDVYCGNVGGDIDAGGNVTCGDVGGSIDAGGDVNGEMEDMGRSPFKR